MEQLLLAKRLLSEADLEKALQVQGKLGGWLGALLMRIGAISEDNLLPVRVEQMDARLVDPSNGQPPPRLSGRIEASGIDLDWLLDRELLQEPRLFLDRCPIRLFTHWCLKALTAN